MKLLYQYTLDYVKRNRRSSIAIMVAILMVTTLLSALSGMLYNMYTDALQYELNTNGNWHGELFDGNLGRELETINSFESVEATMVKGQWLVGDIDDPRRDYLIWRNANAEYWTSMPEGGPLCIMEGRAPAASGEVAISKQYFEHHPELAMGDSITLPLGNRTTPDGALVDPVKEKQPGEQFVPTGESVTLTVVGKLDVTTSSVTPGYTALGFLAPEDILPDDKVTVYLRFDNIRDTYKELPKLAQKLGYKLDEYGAYNLKYNSGYLTRLLIFSPQQLEAMSVMEIGASPITVLCIGLFTVGIFVLVIHNAFALSANARLTQLGILASIGATPRQIKQSVVFEAFILSALPVPVGIVLGQLVLKVSFDFLNYLLAMVNDRDPILFTIGWLSILPTILLSLLTIWWSAVIPARRVAKLSPIAAIRQGESPKLKKPRRHSFGKLFGLEGELAANALRARSKSYRTAVISLVLSLATMLVVLCANTSATASRGVYAHLDHAKNEQDVMVVLHHIASPQDMEITQQLSAIDGVTSAIWYNSLRATTWLAPDELSPEFTAAGGYEEVAKQFPSRLPFSRDGKYRVMVGIAGLEDAFFADYCAQLGIDPAPFYQPGSYPAILYNSIEEATTSTKRNPVHIPYLNKKASDTLTCTEKLDDSYEGDFHFNLEIAAVTDQFPPLATRHMARAMGISHFMPMSRVNELRAQYERYSSNQVVGLLRTESYEAITPVRNAVDKICDSWFGSGDYTVYDDVENDLSRQSGILFTNLMFGFVAGMLAVIGLSNIWATVLGNLSARRREFAMLRSVGLTPRSITKMLWLEALLLGLMPIAIGLPLVAVVQGYLLSLNEVTLLEWLPYAPILPTLLYIAAVIAAVVAAYLVGGKRLRSDNIIDTIKQDMI